MFASLTPAEVKAAKKEFDDAGLKMPKHGWQVELPDGRILARDNKGFYWVHDYPRSKLQWY